MNPQLHELESIDRDSKLAHQSVDALLQAFKVIDDEGDRKMSFEGPTEHEPVPRSLSILADTALNDTMSTPQLPQMRSEPNMGPRSILQPSPAPSSMNHGPTHPRSFMLPHPTPTQQPRRLLPARGLASLPDPFSMTGPPQLPPPPGSNFQRLPLPNYFSPPGPPHAHAPGHPGPPPQGPPPSMYFPSPHGHGPPPQQPRRY